MTEQGLGNSSIQVLGEKKQALSIRTQALEVEKRSQLQTALSEKLGDFNPRATQIDIVGPTLGRELFAEGLLALIIS
ncbi:MAG TPA: protein translocase subunit SecF, partial [Cyanobacteria bacterium UBA11162]|nr:protein translocase subunit SecF [Cyanobacteria bacterium UBA11162]